MPVPDRDPKPIPREPIPTASTSRIRPLLAALAALLAAGLLAACGGGDDAAGGDPEPEQVLEETFGPDAAPDSGVVEASLTAESTDADGDSLEATLEGPFQSEGEDEPPRFDLDLRLDVEDAFAFEGGVTSTGEKGFVGFEGQEYEVGASLFDALGRAFSHAGPEGDGEGSESFEERFGLDPVEWLTDVRNEGTEEIDGTETIHVSGDADVGRVLDDLERISEETGQGEVPETERREIEEAVSGARIDVFSGAEDRILRRLELELELEGSDGTTSVDASLAFSEVGEEQQISAPEDPSPLADLLDQLGILDDLGLLEGLGLDRLDFLEGLGLDRLDGSGKEGSGQGLSGKDGSGDGGGGGGGAGSGSNARERYLECVADPDNSPREIEECAKILEG